MLERIETLKDYVIVEKDYDCFGSYKVYRNGDRFVRTYEFLKTPVSDKLTIKIEDTWEIDGYSLIEKTIKENPTNLNIELSPYGELVFESKIDDEDFAKYIYRDGRWELTFNGWLWDEEMKDVFGSRKVLTNEEMVEFIREISERYRKAA
ncbi:hypothetical protein [Hippea alviniae]|uniref:hypothetical protein n=1 Tax=Hippea alviniae TaxID=1279027 RepID=UPI0003B48A79|nr:hypothetical protein [Hippea alviniae]